MAMNDQLVFMAPKDLRDRLDAVRGNNSLAEEIRASIEFALTFHQLNIPTLDIVQAVADAARHTAANFADWHRDPAARECFRVAVNHMVDRLAVRGEPRPITPKPGSFAEGLFGDRTASPEEAARCIVSWVITEHCRRRDARA